jgi:hypothetical protein
MVSGLLEPTISVRDEEILSSARMPLVVPTFFKLGDPGQDLRYDAFKALTANHAGRMDEYPLVVVDASPDHTALCRPALEAGAVLVDARGHAGLAKQNFIGMRTALRYAPIVGRTEPEKSGLNIVDFDKIADLLDAGVQLVCLGRSDWAMSSLPSEQRVVEKAMNWFGQDVYGLLPDPSCGPRFLGRSALDRLTGFDIAKYPDWQWQLGLLMDLIHAEERVEQVTVDLQHPPRIAEFEQGHPDFALKRKLQAAAMLAFINEYAAQIGLAIQHG